MSSDELSVRLLGIFLEELDDQVRIMVTELTALETEPDDAERLRSLFRVLHTVKGAARVAGVPAIERACHALETELTGVREGTEPLDEQTVHTLYEAADALSDAGQRIRAGQALADTPLARLLLELTGSVPSEFVQRTEVADSDWTTETPTTGPAPRTGRTLTGEPAEGPIRVQPEELDALLASASDLLITHSRIAQRPSALENLNRRLDQLALEWRRSRAALRSVKARGDAPADLAAWLDPFGDGLRAAVREAAELGRDTTDDARGLERITGEITETVSRLRLRPFSDACQALPTVVRDVAAVADRAVDLVLDGQDVRVDRAVIDALREPLVHLVRNAIDHGIEPPAERVEAGKPERGTVRIEAKLLEGRLSVRVSDDGAGLDTDAIRARLEERGLEIAPGERELAHALFAGGLSTREEPTTISGRGVGLDLVRATLERIGGSVDLFWTPGQGTTFVLECPPTPARIRAILATVGAQVFAIPTASVERLRRIGLEEIRSVEGRLALVHEDEPIAFGALAAILGPPLVPRPLAGTVSVVVLRNGEDRLAVAVDDLLAEQELVFRPLERGRSTLPHISGGALLPTGQAALVLNPVGIVTAGIGHPESLEIIEEAQAVDVPAQQRILVVDDSITTRTLEQSILEAAGYEVLTAVDGEDAWQTLQEETIDLVVADVEMPRLDGFGLCEAIRASRRLRELPVVLVTALETAEHHERGLEAGADAYLAKSSFDQETLLEMIQELLNG